MCYFSYLYFEDCCHYGIEVQDYCKKALFSGGLYGKLVLCKPELVKTFVNGRGEKLARVKKIFWSGIQGSCRECVKKFILPPTLYVPSYNQHILGGPFEGKIMAPYVYTPTCRATIPDLLSLELNDSRKPNPEIVFGQRLEKTTWSRMIQSMPWSSKGHWADGSLHLGLRQAHKGLGIVVGLTLKDWISLVKNLHPGQCPEDVYKAQLEGRGVSRELFRQILKALVYKKMISAQHVELFKV